MARKESILVTGASRGLGRHMADYLVSRGFHVFAGHRGESGAAAFAGVRIGGVTPILIDVTDSASILAAAEKIAAAGGVYGLVNNAGVHLTAPIEQTPISDVEAQLRVNVTAPIAVVQSFLPMLRERAGRIVNMSSVSARLTTPLWGVYCASKAALEAISDALRMELKPWGVSVSVIRPGTFATDGRSNSIRAWERSLARLPEERRQLYADRINSYKHVVGLLDAIAGDPMAVSEAVYRALTDDPAEAIYAVGDDVPQLMQLADLPAHERDQAMIMFWSQQPTS